LARNGGFAYGNNAGLRAALGAAEAPDYILLLNPDTVVMPAVLAALVAFMEAHPRCGIAGCRIEDGDGSVACSAHNFPSPVNEFEQGLRFGPVSRLLKKYVVSPPLPPVAHRCGWVSGACLMLRREVLKQVGLMDEGSPHPTKSLAPISETRRRGDGSRSTKTSRCSCAGGARPSGRAPARRRSRRT
jgi:GT2 family glycosyltransferase